jgi:hypothetical protein
MPLLQAFCPEGRQGRLSLMLQDRESRQGKAPKGNHAKGELKRLHQTLRAIQQLARL